MNIVDVLLLVSLVVALANGWRIGIIRGLMGFLGLVVGGWCALQTIPIALDAFALSTVWRLVGGLGVIIGLAMLGQSAGFLIGDALRRLLRWMPIRFVDSMLGSAFRVGSWAVVVWLLSSALAFLPDRGLVHQVRTSEVISVIDSHAPEAADRATAALRNVLRDSRFPQVFADLAPRPVPDVAAASADVVNTPAVRGTFGSIFIVKAQADSCEQVMSGTAFVIAPGRLMTNAHVVAGANIVRVRAWGGSSMHRAEVVAFDPKLDIAVLAVDGLDAPALAFAPEAEIGTEAVVPGFTGGGPLTPDPARVADVLIARGHDIYGARRVDREIYVLRSAIAAGDSGAPLVALDGSVIGVVFAAATDREGIGYALTSQAVRALAFSAPRAQRAVATGACVA